MDRIPKKNIQEALTKKTTVLFYAMFGFVLALTLFLPGEQPERLGTAHFPCVLWLLTAILWIGSNGLKKRFQTGTAFVPFFVFVLVSIAVNLLPQYGGGVRESLNNISVWIAAATVFFLFRNVLQDEPQDGKIVNAVFALLTAVMLSQSVFGLYQQFVEIPALQRNFEADPVAVLASVAPTLQTDTPEWELLAARLRTATPTGTYPLSNSLGGLLGCWLIVLLAVLLNYLQIKRLKNSLAVFITASIAGVIGICFVLTKCRSGYVAVVCGLTLLAVMMLRKRLIISAKRLLIFSLIAVLLAAGLLLLTPNKAVFDGAKRSLGFRLEYWTASLGIIADAPVFGCGSGNFRQTYTKYKLPQSSELIADPHHFAVEIAAESGLPALLLFLAPLGVLLIGSWQLSKTSNSTIKTAADNCPLTSADYYALFWGGLVGCWGAFLFSYATEVAMPPIAPIAAALAFPLCYAVFFQQTDSLHFPPSTIAVFLLVLLIHLSAAGGFSVLSTAILLWLFLALLTNRLYPQTITGGQTKKTHETLCWGIVFVTFLIFVNQFGLRPVLQTRLLTAEINELSTPLQRQAELLQQRILADPYSAANHFQWTTLLFRRWSNAPNDVSLKKETLDSVAETLRLQSRSAKHRIAFAEELFEMFKKTHDPSIRDFTEQLYRSGVEHYPNNAVYRASFALFLQSIGKHADAEKQRTSALELDEQMPHRERKLPPKLRKSLEH